MFKRLKTFVDRHWLAIIVAWVALAVGLRFVSPTWEEVAMDGDLDYLPKNSTSMHGLRLLQAAFPNERAKSDIVLVFARDDRKLDAADRQFAIATAQKLSTQLESHKDLLVDVMTEKTEVIGDMLTAKSGQAVMVVARTTRDMMAMENIPLLHGVQALAAQARKAAPPGLDIGITGSAMIGGDIQDSVEESVASTHYTTVLLVLIALIAIYRAPLLVLVPLATIAVSQSVASDLTALAALYFGPDGLIPGSTFKIFTTSKIFVVVILYGAATDFCLFLISRYKEELADGTPVKEAPGRALFNVSHALFGSAFTTILGLSTMVFAEYGKFVYSGPVVGACLFVALIACVTFSPALLRAIGPAVFWPFGIKRITQQVEASAAALDYGMQHSAEIARGKADWAAGITLRFWNWLAEFILRRPGTILMLTVWVAAPFILFGYHVEVSHDFVAELANDRETIHGTAMIREHFGAGSVAPMTVVASLPNGDLNSKNGKFTIAHLHKALLDMKKEGMVEDVRSLYQPAGGELGKSRVQGRVAAGSPAAKEAFVSQTAPYAGDVTQLTVVITEPPFSKKARDISGRIKQNLDKFAQQKTTVDGENPWYGAKFDLVGTTPGLRDLELTTNSDQTRIQIGTIIAVFLVLLVLIRKPVVCVYLMITVVVSYWVTIGITEQVFTWYYGDTYDGLDWKVPVFLFVILIAVGQDYNIYLTTRVFEEQAKLGQRKGLWRAIVQTGGIITSCGVIMAGTFVSMMTGTLRGMVELGFALSLGVLLDTFFVRTVVVPCYFALIARWFPEKRDAAAAEPPATPALSDSALSRLTARHAPSIVARLSES